MATTRLSRTPASAGSRTTWTWSAWIKLASFSGATFYLEHAGSSGTNDTGLSIESSSRLELFNRISSSVTSKKTTTRKFRDTNGWFHIVAVWDTTNATADDRIRLYVNGVRETAFDISTNPSSSENSSLNNNVAHDIGSVAGGGAGTYFDGSMAHVHFCDGTAYDASAFGQIDATTGIWSPKTAPSVTYGTNGFFLKMENSGSMGTDSSGNSNNFSVGGGTLTQTLDTPSNVFATWNPLDRKATGTPSFANGNLYFSHSANSQINTRSTLAFSKGKYYAEFKITSGDSYTAFGIAEYDTTNVVIADSADGALLGGSGYLSGGAIANGDIIGIAIDADAQTCKWYINNALEATYDYSAKTGLKDSTSLCFGVFSTTSGGTNYTQANFGNGYFGTSAISSPSSDENGLGLFQYQPPTGYLSLCTKSINAQEYA